MIENKRPIGIHVRLHTGLSDLIDKIDSLQLPIVQHFLLKEDGTRLSYTEEELATFNTYKQEHPFIHLIHAAYWSGLTSSNTPMFRYLKKEMAMAYELGADGIIIHPGPIKLRGLSHEILLKRVAYAINSLHKSYPNMMILIENAPHAGKNFGGVLEDFDGLTALIKNKSYFGFCFDIAHAFVYGYDFNNPTKKGEILEKLATYWKKEYITLLHMNDATHHCGSHIDKHEIPGFGAIGKQTIKQLMHDPLFKDTPIIIEQPINTTIPDPEIIKMVKDWNEEI